MDLLSCVYSADFLMSFGYSNVLKKAYFLARLIRISPWNKQSCLWTCLKLCSYLLFISFLKDTKDICC